MKKNNLFLIILLVIVFTSNAQAQRKAYLTSGGEVIFSWGDLKFTEAYAQANPEAKILSTPTRFTCVFHFGEFAHLNLNNFVGFYTGIGMRNIGFITNEVLPNPENAGSTFDAKVIRRTYNLGIPLAMKIGSFKDNFHVYLGGEYEWAFHYKEKYWRAHSRDGEKTKTTKWWPGQVTSFIPSAFVGVQFPKGINLKFKYYLDNMLNHNYVKDPVSENAVVSDLSKYEQSQIMYISFSVNLNTKEKVKKSKVDEEVVHL
jgi:hypothetical protein